MEIPTTAKFNIDVNAKAEEMAELGRKFSERQFNAAPAVNHQSMIYAIIMGHRIAEYIDIRYMIPGVTEDKFFQKVMTTLMQRGWTVKEMKDQFGRPGYSIRNIELPLRHTAEYCEYPYTRKDFDVSIMETWHTRARTDTIDCLILFADCIEVRLAKLVKPPIKTSTTAYPTTDFEAMSRLKDILH